MFLKKVSYKIMHHLHHIFNFFLEFFITWKYLRSPNLTPIFNTSTRLTLLFMALMVFVMVVVLCVFVGFQDAMKETFQTSGYHLRITKNNSHPFSEKDSVVYIDEDEEIVKKHTKLKFQSISLNVLMESYGEYDGKALRGIPLSTPLDKNKNIEGQFRYFPHIIYYNKQYLEKFDTGNYVLIGREMARIYGLQLGDSIKLLIPKGGLLNTNIDVSTFNFIIAGFYRTGFYEYDSNLIFVSLKTAQRTLQIPKQITELVFQLKSLDKLFLVEELINEKLANYDYHYITHSINEEKGNILAALQLEKTLMLVILSLLVMAGVAGIWVTVRLLVRSKTRSIGLLKAMGLPSHSLIIIFTSYALCIGFIASFLGGTIGIFVANHLEIIITLIEESINYICLSFNPRCSLVKLIPPYIYFFDHLPVKADLNILLGISLSSLVLSGLAGYFPARDASRVDPIESLRNE